MSFLRHIHTISPQENCPNAEFFSGSYFPAFGLNTEIYGVNLGIQSDYRKIRTRKNFVYGHFSRSVSFDLLSDGSLFL